METTTTTEKELKGLSVRAANVLLREGIDTRLAAREAIEAGRLKPGLRGPRGYGAGSHREVCRWCGLEPGFAGRPVADVVQEIAKTFTAEGLRVTEYSVRVVSADGGRMWLRWPDRRREDACR